MSLMIDSLPKLHSLPESMPEEGAISITLQEGVPIFRAAKEVQERIKTLLDKQKMAGLTTAEIEELDHYAEVDDYLSHLNRIARNLAQQK